MIFDSSVWAALASADLEHEAVIAVAGDMQVFASTVSLGELRFGVEICEDPAQRALRAAFLRQVETRPVLDLTRHTAAAFGMLAAAVKRTGRSPRPRYNDLWLAAQAIEHGYAVLTRNARDFADLPGLRIIAI
ncbi:PIN domain-containing protein [Dokdonella sp.]|uniref:PIN domain-containing protein n=1 Tax=Dokdonella sp. TaxID=2291710 RepID=UPI0025BB3A5F|nr:PIN domain-containing protein [Dokdonella sp.]MBX3692521.1 PIN domain-containing protein [Dokdonella sp.]MCW5568115.1 PIN domain-containing protein [Dokdonella sp.]